MAVRQKHDHISRASYIGLHLEACRPYYCLCQVARNGPSFEEVAVPKSDRVRRKYTPPFDTLEVQLSDGSSYWCGIIEYERHNVTRKKAGGRDDTWSESVFLYKVADALQNSPDRPNVTIKVTENETEGSLGLEIKENDNGIIWNYLRNFTLTMEDPDELSDFLPLFHEIYFSSLVDMCRTGNVAKAKLRYFEDIDVNGFDSNGWTLLQYAAYFGHVGVVEWLIDELGADATVSKESELTPVLCAAKNNHIAVIDFLISRGVSIGNGSCIESTVPAVLLRNREKASLEYICGNNGPIALETAVVTGVRDTTPVIGMFQLP